MKKIKFIFFVCLLATVFIIGMNFNMGAALSDSELQAKYCPKKPFDIAKPSTRALQTSVGGNLMAEKIAEATVKKAFRSFAKGNLNVKAKSFSITDAKQGKFESFEISGNRIIADSLYVSELHSTRGLLVPTQ